ncbi:hypothetical protein TNCV_2406841 [Trichonephila clavipes]|nr:hypothetical protein TNCV_2406841 [Trichonephila clavipes]
MVWTAIMTEGHTDLHAFDRSILTSQRYRDEILLPISDFYSHQMDQISSLWMIMYAHRRLSWWTNTFNWQIFNNLSDLRCPLTLIPLDTYGTSLDVQRSASRIIGEFKRILLQEWVWLSQGLRVV